MKSLSWYKGSIYRLCFELNCEFKRHICDGNSEITIDAPLGYHFNSDPDLTGFVEEWDTGNKEQELSAWRITYDRLKDGIYKCEEEDCGCH